MIKLTGLLLLAVRARTFDATTTEERQHPCGNEISSAPRSLVVSHRPPGGENGDHFGDAVTCASTGWPMLVGARGHEDDEGAVYIYSGPDDVAPVIVQPPDSPVDHVEFGYSVAYASGKFVVGAREIGADKIGVAFLYSL